MKQTKTADKSICEKRFRGEEGKVKYNILGLPTASACLLACRPSMQTKFPFNSCSMYIIKRLKLVIYLFQKNEMKITKIIVTRMGLWLYWFWVVEEKRNETKQNKTKASKKERKKSSPLFWRDCFNYFCW